MQAVKTFNKDIVRGGASFLLSVVIHAVVFVLLGILLTYLDNDDSLSTGYVELTAIRGLTSPPEAEKKEETAPDELSEEIVPEESKPEEKSANDASVALGIPGFDSTSLNQVYKEPTLNLKIKYPVGWVYLDQQVKKKIDGITFWAAQSNYNPPPYIHVEVLEKYLFNESRYKYKYDFRDFMGYYNDPVEMDNQVTQVVYIRTEDDEDFSIKLIMNGREQFKSFQPVFFSMIKSFRFGNSIF